MFEQGKNESIVQCLVKNISSKTRLLSTSKKSWKINFSSVVFFCRVHIYSKWSEFYQFDLIYNVSIFCDYIGEKLSDEFNYYLLFFSLSLLERCFVDGAID